MANPRDTLRSGILDRFNWLMLRIGFFMPQETLILIHDPDTSLETLLQALLETHETALAMFTLETRTTLVRQRFNEVILQIKTIQTALENESDNLSLLVDAVFPQLNAAWKLVENGIYDETQQREDFLQTAVTKKLETYYPDPKKRQEIISQFLTNDSLHKQYQNFFDPKYTAVAFNKTLHFLTHYINAEEIEHCITLQYQLFDNYRQHITRTLIQSLQDHYELSYHHFHLFFLLNTWLKQLEKMTTPDAHTFTRTKIQFLSLFIKEMNIKDFFFLLKFQQTYQKQTDIAAAEFLRKLVQQCQTARQQIQGMEAKFQPRNWVGQAQSFANQAIHTCYYVDIAQLILNALIEVAQLVYDTFSKLYSLVKPKLPDVSHYICPLPNLSQYIQYELTPIIKKLSIALITLALLASDNSLIYMTIMTLNRLMFSQFNLLCAIAEKFSGDEITVLNYLSLAEQVSRYLLFMSFAVFSSVITTADFEIFNRNPYDMMKNVYDMLTEPDDVRLFDNMRVLLQNVYQHAIGVLPTAHVVYFFSELYQYLYAHIATPFFTRLIERYPQHRHIITLLYPGIMLSGLIVNQQIVDQTLLFLPLPELPTKPPSCNATQAFLNLGLQPGAASADILHAWKKTSQLHPDKPHGEASAFTTASTAMNCLREKGLVNRGSRVRPSGQY